MIPMMMKKENADGTANGDNEKAEKWSMTKLIISLVILTVVWVVFHAIFGFPFGKWL